ncbi:peptidoglycan-binding protein [Streptomyces silvisoli]|uniref:Peptidoglycan-binding protein n=1 Tax=Streptomyces silvisoli TaxID=3034235 RepID=A0ABT5ZUA3_9ACTN|nr:peptidoglycan-binding protein [Streptomyces silvisoli]MDF3293226.1 peptidoglycan-binding protein [Streptomyces silvisoli]
MSATPEAGPLDRPGDSNEFEDAPPAGRRRDGRRRGRRARRVTGAVVTLVAVTAMVFAAQQQGWLGGRDGGKGESPAKPEATAVVERTSLSTGMDVKGTIGYGHETDAVGRVGGTLTAIRQVGDVVRPGEWLWERDGVRVPYFRGDRPLWRVLKKNASGKEMRGEDVRDLKRNLIDLGYADGLGLTADDTFTDATETAVKRWQKQLGAPQTGQVDPGSVVMLDMPRLRVSQAVGVVGSSLTGTALLKVTGTDLVATAKVSYDQLSRLSPGTRLKVALPNGNTMSGKVTAVDITPQQQQDGGGQGQGGDTKQQAEVTVSLQDQKTVKAGGLGPATLTVSDHTADRVLAVPVTALLALAEGGYGVEVVQPDGQHKLVPVTIGLVADARAEITKGDLKEGTKVVIPE